jgi:hypothetical protein
MGTTVVGFRGCFVVEPKVGFAVCRIWTVALEAMLREDRTDLESEIDGVIGVGVGGEQSDAWR